MKTLPKRTLPENEEQTLKPQTILPEMKTLPTRILLENENQMLLIFQLSTVR
jgi:hypothetical protein